MGAVKWLLSLIFAVVVRVRRWLYRTWLRPAWPHDVKIIVVGNISVGGSGKTPCVQALTQALQQRGWRVGIVARGYGARRSHRQPAWVDPEGSAELYGEECSWLARTTGAPMVVCVDRRAAARTLLQRHAVDVLISDDGLQHYALARHLELIMLPSPAVLERASLLPAGELREPLTRLSSADFLLDNLLTNSSSARVELFQRLALTGDNIYALQAASYVLVRLSDKLELTPAEWQARHAGLQVQLCCAIAHPQRFLAQMARLTNLELRPRYFPDHHLFKQQDFTAIRQELLVMTEKDAVKCAGFDLSNPWYLRIRGTLPAELLERLERQLRADLPLK